MAKVSRGTSSKRGGSPDFSKLELMVTLWPSFPHFSDFVSDNRVDGIRLNSAMITNAELEKDFAGINWLLAHMAEKLFFDVKGRQLRITDVCVDQDVPKPENLAIRLNHPIKVTVPSGGLPVYFKAAADGAMLDRVEEDGYKLVFRGGPKYKVHQGESLHILDKSLEVGGPTFTDVEIQKVEQVKRAGFTRYFLSYVENQRDVDQFLELVGKDAEVMLKIESEKGLRYVAEEFKKKPNLTLVAARGDLYVEISRPHQILNAMKLIIGKDPAASVGSRILLSVIPPLEKRKDDNWPAELPSCADFHELAWLYDIGYRKMMLCDELCLRKNLLEWAVGAFDAFRNDYAYAQ